MLRSKLLAALALTVAAASSGCAYPRLSEIAPKINATICGEAFIVVGDVIKLTFPQRPEWNHDSPVRSDGNATFPFLGDLQVVGLSMKALDEKLAAAYSTQSEIGVRRIVVDLAQAAPREVAIIGEVNNPGAVAFGNGNMTLIEAIARAGGPVKGCALLEETLLIRWNCKEQRQETWRLDASIDQWQDGPPLLMQPHDVVFVPNNAIDRVNVWVDKYIRQNLPMPFAFALR